MTEVNNNTFSKKKISLIVTAALTILSTLGYGTYSIGSAEESGKQKQVIRTMQEDIKECKSNYVNLYKEVKKNGEGIAKILGHLGL